MTPATREGCTAVQELRPRRRQRTCGVLVALTYRPAGQVPALVGRLSDGTGSVELVWLGRRTIPGIEPGRELVAEGMVATGAGGLTMYNPVYEIRTAVAP